MLTQYDPKSPAFCRLGRFDPSEAACELWWSGAGIRTNLACTRLEAEVETPEGPHMPWLAAVVDGAPVARFALMPGRHRYAVLSGMDGATVHEVELLRDTQPTDQDAGPVKLLGLHTDGAPALPRPRARLIEFIGDSLTVGEGTVGAEDEQEWIMAWISNIHAFPERVARRLDADKRVVALGGWGAYRAWDGDGEHRIGRVYDRLCGVMPAGQAPFDFAAQRHADAVVINLGTNDASGIDKLPGDARAGELERLTDSAEALLAQVRAAQPEAWILWTYGLCKSVLRAPLEAAVARRQAAGDGRVRYVPLTDSAGDVGSRSHPSRRAHARAAAEIAAALEEVL